MKKLFRILPVCIIAVMAYFFINADELCREYIYPIKYADYVETFSYQNGLDKYFVYAIIKTESNFDSEAVSDVGARGLMQLMEDAFDWVKFRMGDERNITYNDMFDPCYNIEYGTFMIKLLYDEYSDEKTALAAYFMGRGQVNEWLKNKKYSDDGKTLSVIPSAAAEHYVKKVMNAYGSYQNLYNTQ